MLLSRYCLIIAAWVLRAGCLRTLCDAASADFQRVEHLRALRQRDRAAAMPPVRQQDAASS